TPSGADRSAKSAVDSRLLEPAQQPEELWGRVLEHIRCQVPGDAFDTWLAPTKGCRVDQDLLVVEVPNPFFVDWINQYFSAAIAEAVRSVLGEKIRIAFRNGADEGDAGKSVLPALEKRAQISQRHPSFLATSARLQERYTFSSFIVADCNRFAYAAAKAVAESPGSKYNPLLVYGGVGLGKTHLIQAIGNHSLHSRKDFKVYYTPAESLFTELIAAIERGDTMEFKRKYRSQDMLLIDDVHYLVGKERLQEEVFHIFNHLHGLGRQVVFTSDRPVSEIPTLEERLSSRLTSGLVVDLQPPDLETRVALLKHKAEQDGFRLSQEVALYIASRIKTNIRQLEGCLIRLTALASMGGDTISTDLAAKVLRDIIPRRRTTSRELILERVCETFGVSLAEVNGRSRTRRITIARQAAMYLYRNLLGMSLKEIGGHFGSRDHTTVLHSISKIEQQKSVDSDLASRLEGIIVGLEG
ncbi:MAG: chromosomal replication initiator protein DnaA, partial [candidate division WOR-3 bacterium]